ncbi:hypothetical protein QF050_001683 [Arthrobacter sp. SLBN-112]|nr:hypothetical protein [Arthrobacter sp. SLBN-112]
MSSAARSQSAKNSRAFGFRKVNRALFGGVTSSVIISRYSARPSSLAARTSPRSLRTQAGAVVIASMTRCTLGRTVSGLRLRRTRGAAVDARARSKRWAVSASSNCKARASASRTLSEAPERFPRSSRM